MPTSSSLSSWLTDNRARLAERCSKLLTGQLGRLLERASDPDVLSHGHGLLMTLAELVQHPVTGTSADDRLASVLELVRTLQTDQHLSSTELVLLLLTLRDTLNSLANPSGASNAHVDVSELSNLLGRMALVLLEEPRAAADENQVQDSNLVYALRYERARRMAITDSLTGLSNFGYFRERLTEERRRAERYQRLLSLVLLDLDHFKRYNDKHGHPAGNEVLKSVAAVLREQARETDLAARYGGEELVLLLPEANRRTAWEVAERVRHCVAELRFEPALGHPEQVTLSAGVATFPVDATDDEELVARADASLYQAKARGRNRVVAYQPPHRLNLVYRSESWIDSVALVGNFNNWDKLADPMQRRDDGAFEFLVSLTPGRYHYKFVLNGKHWTPDPANPETEPDNMGGANSVLHVPASA